MLIFLLIVTVFSVFGYSLYKVGYRDAVNKIPQHPQHEADKIIKAMVLKAKNRGIEQIALIKVMINELITHIVAITLLGGVLFPVLLLMVLWICQAYDNILGTHIIEQIKTNFQI